MKGWSDLKGMRIGVPRGTPQDTAVTKGNPPGATIQRFDDDATTVQALVSGQVDAIGAAVTQVNNLNKVAGAGKYESRMVLQRVFNGAAVRPGEREWVGYLNVETAPPDEFFSHPKHERAREFLGQILHG